MKTNEVSSATETNEADFVKLEEKNRKVAEATCAEEAWSRSTYDRANQAWVLY